MHAPTPTASSLKSLLRSDRAASYLLAMSIFAACSFAFAITYFMSAVAQHPALRVLFASCNGLVSGLLFIIGHDACHQSFTPSSLLNRLLGRIAFLPSYHLFCCWELAHNRIHHSFTNCKEVDYVWTPP